MMRRLSILVIAVATLFVAACTTNISGDSRYPTGFRAGQVYVLTRELHGVVNRNFGRTTSISILTPAGYEVQLKKNKEARSIEKVPLLVKSDEKDFVRIDARTEILVTGVEVVSGGSGREMVLFSEFVSGPFRGERVDLAGICHAAKLPGGSMFGWMAVRDPEYLVEKKEPNQSLEPTRLRRSFRSPDAIHRAAHL
jgi:hypothetical protein